MDPMEPEKVDEELQSETPEDVAVLYSWAKLQGAKYRDFSASRREYRAQMRHRAAESQRESERKAQAEAEVAASATEKAAREAEEVARFHESAARQAAGSALRGESAIEEAASVKAAQAAAELARRAASERIEAARRAEAVAAAEAASRREEREISEAHASAQRQARRYEESEVRRRAAAGPQPLVGGEISDPYPMEGGPITPDRIYHLPVVPQDDMAPARFRQSRERNVIVPQPETPAFDASRADSAPRSNTGAAPARRSSDRPHPLRRATDKPQTVPSGYAAVRDDAGWYFEPTGSVAEKKADSGEREAGFLARQFSEPAPAVSQLSLSETQAKRDAYAASVSRTRQSGERRAPKPYRLEESSGTRPAYGSQLPNAERSSHSSSTPERPSYERASEAQGPAIRRPEVRLDGARPVARPLQPLEQHEPETAVPAWLYNPQPTSPQPPSALPPPPTAKRVPQPMSPVEDTLQHSRERVAARWFALKGVFEQGVQEPYQEAQVQRGKDLRAPLLSVFSLAGGVGKTSLVATLGRALSSTGERVLLTDTTSHGLLPFYFGASELRPGAVRTFSPPSGSTDAPIYLVSYDVNEKTGDTAAQDWLAAEMERNSRGMQRVLVDLTPNGAWVARKLARMNSTLLVPVAPDMNSVISLQGVEKFFAGMTDGDGRPVQPYYVLNQFDASLALHLDVREVMRQQLADRLLPFAIRRSPSVSEALAEGMTVMDYAPESTVAGDYMNLVSWLHAQAAPVASGLKSARWSER
jgi:cellulose synthase operon protein YhjQ